MWKRTPKQELICGFSMLPHGLTYAAIIFKSRWDYTLQGVKGKARKRFMKKHAKTTMCIDWERAREKAEPPEGSPAWWGCPRGDRCEFAHGEAELRGALKEVV